MDTMTVYNLYSEVVDSWTDTKPIHTGTFGSIAQVEQWLADNKSYADGTQWWLKMERKVLPEYQRAGGTRVKDYTYFTIYEVEVTLP